MLPAEVVSLLSQLGVVGCFVIFVIMVSPYTEFRILLSFKFLEVITEQFTPVYIHNLFGFLAKISRRVYRRDPYSQ